MAWVDLYDSCCAVSEFVCLAVGAAVVGYLPVGFVFFSIEGFYDLDAVSPVVMYFSVVTGEFIEEEGLVCWLCLGVFV